MCIVQCMYLLAGLGGESCDGDRSGTDHKEEDISRVLSSPSIGDNSCTSESKYF